MFFIPTFNTLGDDDSAWDDEDDDEIIIDEELNEKELSELGSLDDFDDASVKKQDDATERLSDEESEEEDEIGSGNDNILDKDDADYTVTKQIAEFNDNSGY
jgi:hypothetical protein